VKVKVNLRWKFCLTSFPGDSSDYRWTILWDLRNYLLGSNERVKTPHTMSGVQFLAKRLIDLVECIGVKGYLAGRQGKFQKND